MLPYRLTTEALTFAGREVVFTRVAEPDEVLDVAARENHVEPPYWATIWDSGRALADWAASHVERGITVLDLGCGSGIVGVAALAAGGVVTFADWEPAALELARRNAAVVGGTFAIRRVNWLTDRLGKTFDLILGADVLYEPAMADAVLAFCREHVATEGQVVLADPNQRHADALVAMARLSAGTVTPFQGGRLLHLSAL